MQANYYRVVYFDQGAISKVDLLGFRPTLKQARRLRRSGNQVDLYRLCSRCKRQVVEKGSSTCLECGGN